MWLRGTCKRDCKYHTGSDCAPLKSLEYFVCFQLELRERELNPVTFRVMSATDAPSGGVFIVYQIAPNHPEIGCDCRKIAERNADKKIRRT